jgi:N-acetylglucosaminyl-diphospho-decaprenol L-rhamnosyltransferase
VVRLGENRGAAARNEGVRRAGTPYVAFADDDSYWTDGSFGYGEEALLAMDLTAAGWWLCYVPSLVVRHFPRPAGRDGTARDRIEARNRLLTSVLRRPPGVVARTAAATLRDSPPALWDVARSLPWALRHRRRLPRSAEAVLARL